MGDRVKAYKKYEARLKLLGYPANSSWVQCKVDEEHDKVMLRKVNCGQPVVTIPSFVQNIDEKVFVLWHINNRDITYKICYNGRWDSEQDFQWMFMDSRFKHLDLTDFSLKGQKTLEMMFVEQSVETIIFGDETLDSLESTKQMFQRCVYLKYVDMSKLKIPNLKDASRMFQQSGIVRADLSGINQKSLQDMKSMFHWCNALEHLIIQPRTYGYNKDCGADINNMFYGCGKLDSSGLITKDRNIKEALQISKRFSNRGMQQKK